jgi:ATP-binding cassette, subfamily B, bacterial MsbA
VFCIAAAPVIGWLMQIANRSFRRYSERIQNSMGDITRVAKEAIDAHRLIKIFNAEDHQTRAIRAGQRAQPRLEHEACRAKAVSNPVVQLHRGDGARGVLYVAIRQVFAHSMQFDDFLAFWWALMLPAPLRSLVNISGPLQQGIAAGQSVFELLDHPTEGSGGTRSSRGRAARSNSATCRSMYGGDKGDVLHEVSFTVRPGRRWPSSGRSGSGKTTLVGLVPRFYDVQQGACCRTASTCASTG